MRSVSVATLKERIRRRTDQENSDFIEDDELLEYINSAYAEYYGLITTIYEDYSIKFADFITSNDKTTYNLPSDFFKLTGVDYQVDSDRVIELDNLPFEERNRQDRVFYTDGYNTNVRYLLLGNTIVFLPAPPNGSKMKMWYVPTAPLLTSDTQLIDGINGYEEMIIAEVSIRIMNKQEQDAGPFVGTKRAVQRRIEAEAPNRDAGNAPRVSDARGLETPYYYPYFSRRQ